MHTLSLAACRKRQSARTGFVHLEDTIPTLENFHFALALCLQKTREGVGEARDLLTRLLAYRSSTGNFPVYLHDFPHTYDACHALRLAPILLRLHREFGTYLPALPLHPFIPETLSPLWAHRLAALKGEPLPDLSLHALTASEWAEAILSFQMAGIPSPIPPVHPELQFYCGNRKGCTQSGTEPTPVLVEWLFEGTLTPRLSADHPLQIRLAAYHSLPLSKEAPPLLAWLGDKRSLHTIETTGQALPLEKGWELTFDLPEGVEVSREDLYEAVLYLNRSPEHTLKVNGLSATTFQLGDRVTWGTRSLVFELLEGEGRFVGHLIPANRPSQAATGYAAHDWKIGLRTLRRTGACRIRVQIG